MARSSSTFEKGRKKTGGKVKGCKHKINRDIIGLLDKLKCNPVEGLALIATDPKVDIAVRVHAYGKIIKHVHPELKAVEHTGPGGGPIQHEHSSAADELLSRIGGIAARIGKTSGDHGDEAGTPSPTVV